MTYAAMKPISTQGHEPQRRGFCLPWNGDVTALGSPKARPEHSA